MNEIDCYEPANVDCLRYGAFNTQCDFNDFTDNDFNVNSVICGLGENEIGTELDNDDCFNSQNDFNLADNMNSDFHVNSVLCGLSENEMVNDIINESCETSDHDLSIVDECSMDITNGNFDVQENDEPWSCLKKLRNSHPKNLIFGTLNINSIRNKFQCLKHVFSDNLIDILTICESKLDASFPKAQFHVDGFSVFRQDSSATSGGVMVYIRNDIPCRRRCEFEFACHENQSICLEFSIRNEKWFLLSNYILPSSNVNNYCNQMGPTLDKILSESSNVILTGDFNVDMLSKSLKFTALNDVLQMYNLQNIITNGTCFKGSKATLLDLIIVSKPKRYGSTLNFNCGLSDCHNFVLACTKLQHARFRPKMVTYRSYKNFDEENFKYDISNIPYQILDVFDNVDDKFWCYNKLIMNVIDDHAPLKKKFLKKPNAPHMNGRLRKAIFKKRMAQNKYKKYRDPVSWEKYRIARNAFVNLNRLSLRNYFQERCMGGTQSRSFWDTIRPFITDKCVLNKDIMLCENDSVVTDHKSIVDIFNNFFKDATMDIGINENMEGMQLGDCIQWYANHPSVLKIQTKKTPTWSFTLSPVNETQVQKLLSQVNPRKSTGYDNFPSKLLKVVSRDIAPSMTSLINHSINTHIFPAGLKYAELSPVFKKDDPLNKKNYRPISILPCMSKIFEKVLNMQISSYFYESVAENLSAFRHKHNTQSLLIKAVEDWKYALDENKYVGAILTDLSKAFDVVPHGLLLAKLNAYGFQHNDVMLIKSYLSNRNFRTKIQSTRSDWCAMTKGVPQGSILGPTLFNIFLNDIFYFTNDYTVYNYADDTTISYCAESPHDLVDKLESCANIVTDWFVENGMKANPNKYQAIVFGNKTNSPVSFTIKGNVLKCIDNVKLLGIDIDSQLNFDKHLKSICTKAGRQINAIMRLSNILDIKVKESMYKTFIKSTFNYCPVVWMMCSKGNLTKLEKLQCRALRFVYCDYLSSYDELLTRSRQLSLSIQLMQNLAVEVYKCMNGSAPAYLCSLFDLQNHKYNCRGHKSLKQKKFKTIKHGYQSFTYMGSKLWNALPNEARKSADVNTFKKAINDFNFCNMHRLV